jgi:hypothetical protein
MAVALLPAPAAHAAVYAARAAAVPDLVCVVPALAVVGSVAAGLWQQWVGSLPGSAFVNLTDNGSAKKDAEVFFLV